MLKSCMMDCERGFTLLEVMMALAVLSIGIIGAQVMQGTSIRGNATANTITTASTITADRIERILNMDYDLLDDGNGDGAAGLNDSTVADADGNDIQDNYQIFWNVVVDSPMPYTKTVRVIVNRLERGVTRRVTYDYILASKVSG